MRTIQAILQDMATWPMPSISRLHPKFTRYARAVADRALEAMDDTTKNEYGVDNEWDICTISSVLESSDRYAGIIAEDVVVLIEFIKYGETQNQ